MNKLNAYLYWKLNDDLLEHYKIFNNDEFRF